MRDLTTLALVMLIIFTLTISYVYAEDFYRIKDLNFIVYSDGVVKVLFRLSVNESYPVFTMPIIGSPALDLLVYNSKGELVEFDLEGENLTIYSLGESELYVEYDTQSLTGKEGVIWTFKVESPIEFQVTLPYNASIVDISEIPLEITILKDGRMVVEMPKGLQFISYIIPPGVSEFRIKASNAISKAQTAIAKAKAEERTEGLEEAERLLEEAQTLYNQGSYLDAEQKALQAYETAERAKVPLSKTLLSYMPYIVVGAVFLVAATLIALRRRRGGVERILRENPWLDEDEKNVLRVIWIKGGEAFEADIREALNLPRTTVWRIVKKLEREGLVKIEKIRGENYVRIIKG